jgi:hypothetical protein
MMYGQKIFKKSKYLREFEIDLLMASISSLTLPVCVFSRDVPCLLIYVYLSLPCLSVISISQTREVPGICHSIFFTFFLPVLQQDL